jgi:hypothetical protein
LAVGLTLVREAEIERGGVSADNLFGRVNFENPPYGYSYVPEREAAAADTLNGRLFVWIDPAKWGVAPALAGKRVALVANSPITGLGPTIDAHDEVIRINRMEYWRRSADDDGRRLTIWAGLPKPQVIWGSPRGGDKDATHTNFPDVAQTASIFWSATPFELSVPFYDFLRRRGLVGRLFVSGSGPFLQSYLAQRLPPAMARAMLSNPSVRAGDQIVFDKQTYFEILLTGIRLILFCMLAGPREIGLFGFNFYDGTSKRPAPIHNLAFEKELLAALVEIAPRFGCRIVRFGR